MLAQIQASSVESVGRHSVPVVSKFFMYFYFLHKRTRVWGHVHKYLRAPIVKPWRPMISSRDSVTFVLAKAPGSEPSSPIDLLLSWFPDKGTGTRRPSPLHHSVTARVFSARASPGSLIIIARVKGTNRIGQPIHTFSLLITPLSQ
jgi:hypothetical protein